MAELTRGQRIRGRRIELGLTQEDLAEAARMTQTAISKIEADLTNPRRSTLAAIEQALGLGEDTLSGVESVRERPASYVARALQSAVERVLPTEFPIYDQAAGAGPGIEVADYGFTEPGLEWRDVFGIRAQGRSMEPAILDGDLLVVARDRAPEPGDIVVASSDEGLVVKRLKRKGRTLVLAGDADGELPYDATKIEGTVVEIRRRPR